MSDLVENVMSAKQKIVLSKYGRDKFFHHKSDIWETGLTNSFFLNTGLFKMELFLSKVNSLKLLMVATKSSVLNLRYFIKDQWGVALIS